MMKDWRKSFEPLSMMGSAPDISSMSNEETGDATHPLSQVASTSDCITLSPPNDAAVTTAGQLHRRRARFSLVDMARRVIAARLHMYDSFGDAPFRLVRPLLEQCVPAKLWSLEEESPHLICDTNEIWRRHCEKLRNVQHAIGSASSSSPTGLPLWREVYRARMIEEHQAKLDATERIKKKYAMLRASKEASQVRIVSETPTMRGGVTAVALAKQSAATPTPGQRMLNKARRTAHTHAKVTSVHSRSGQRNTVGTFTHTARRSALAGPSTFIRTSAPQRSPHLPSSPPRSRVPVGFERKATADATLTEAMLPTPRSSCRPDTMGHRRRRDVEGFPIDQEDAKRCKPADAATATSDQQSSEAAKAPSPAQSQRITTTSAARKRPARGISIVTRKVPVSSVRRETL